MMSYNKYICSANDRIDLIVNKHYGSLNNLNTVIEHNPELFDKSMNLTSGTVVKLPIYIIEDKKVLEPINELREPLW
jgi:phage tail protein X